MSDGAAKKHTTGNFFAGLKELDGLKTQGVGVDRSEESSGG